MMTEKAYQKKRTVFITVGTTLFEPLIECVSNSSFLNAIGRLGYSNLIVQYGKGQIPRLRRANTKKKVHHQGHSDYDDGDTSSGEYICTSNSNDTISIQWEVYRFKSSLEEDMKNADLIISHAGAGSVMEGLEHCHRRNNEFTTANNHKQEDQSPELYKKLVVVINDKLMNNHQCELAYALEKRNYLFVLPKPEYLLEEDRLETIVNEFLPKSFEGGNDASFGLIVDDFMGYKNG